LNLLRRLNRELGADFSLDSFRHRAIYNVNVGRIEMHLVSSRSQRVALCGQEIRLDEGETICSEYSYKYAPQEFHWLARQAGLEPRQTWTDSRGWFGVGYLIPARRPEL